MAGLTGLEADRVQIPDDLRFCEWHFGQEALLYAAGGTSVPQFPPLWHYILIGLIGGVVGQIGDLYASLVKRHCGIKDYGTIFPGHGGMMDRLDSTLFVAVLVYLYQSIL